MTIHLPKDVESRLQAAVLGGRFASVEDATAEAVRLLLKNLEQRQPEASSIAPESRKAKPARQKAKPAVQQAMSEQDFLNHLLKVGLMTRLPDTASDFDDPDDQPITVKGEPLSETIIRERR